LASQGYLQDDLGRPKVQATGDMCHQINHGLEIYEVNGRFRRSMDIGTILFVCVDKIEVRRLIWESVKDRVSFFSDGRMSAEVLRVLTAYDIPSRDHYPHTLFLEQHAQMSANATRTTAIPLATTVVPTSIPTTSLVQEKGFAAPYRSGNLSAQWAIGTPPAKPLTTAATSVPWRLMSVSKT
ncbi:MAG: hypothetical protein GY809_10260, partial [Planctomycetes bacterium]|nr:hypothetical protein [Planctomycetota bacterium]